MCPCNTIDVDIPTFSHIEGSVDIADDGTRAMSTETGGQSDDDVVEGSERVRIQPIDTKIRLHFKQTQVSQHSGVVLRCSGDAAASMYGIGCENTPLSTALGSRCRIYMMWNYAENAVCYCLLRMQRQVSGNVQLFDEYALAVKVVGK